MEDIENKAYETYQKNLEYLSKEQKHVAKLLTIFDRALGTGEYIPTLDLEYKEGYFDVKNIDTGTYLYGDDSNKLSKQLKEQVNLKKDNNNFEGIPIYNISQKQLDNPPEDFKVVEGVLHIMKYYVQNTHADDSMLHLDKLILIGTGLGMHIPMIADDFSVKEYFIIEDNLELFKLSLFTTEYYALAKNAKLYFSIADEENTFIQLFNSFLDNNFFYNRYLKYVKFPTHTNDKIKQLQNGLITQSFIFFPYKASLFKYLKPLEYINDGYNLINIGGDFSDTVFTQKPLLVLAAGPSLLENIEWLKANHQKFIVVAISTILNTLHKHDIKPDIVTQLDGGDTSLKFYEDALKDDFLDNVPMLFGPNIPVKVRKLFKKEQIYYYDEGDNFIHNFTSINSPCIGSLTTLISLYLGAKELFLLGINLAVDQETGQSHSADYMYGYQSDTENKDKLSNVMESQRNLFQVKGNFREIVYTNAIMHASVQSLYRTIPVLKKADQNIYNLNDGSYITKTIPAHANEINVSQLATIDKKSLYIDIKNALDKNSIKKLSKEDISLLKRRLEDALDTRKELEKYAQSVSHSNKEQYLYDMLGIVSYILHKRKPESVNLTAVYLLFFKYALTTILDFFNTKSLKNAKRHIKKIDKLMLDEMFSIVDIYIDGLEKFIQERC